MATKEFWRPAYNFDTSEPSVLLKESNIEVSLNKIAYSGKGDAILSFIPQPRIHINGYFSSSQSNELVQKLFLENKTSFKFSFYNCDIDVSPINIYSTDKEAIVKFRLNRELVSILGDESTRITCAIFHLYNFFSYGMKTIWLTNDEWKVGLQSLDSTYDNIKALKSEGGYRLTHVGKIMKTGGSCFSGKEALDIIDALRFFLSFARGCWCIPVCPVGFDRSGERIWELWSTPSESWRVVKSWFDPIHSNQIEKLFPGFLERWSNENFREGLREAIYWYLIANSIREVDAGIILTQAALERLSYEFCINDRELMREKGFKKLRSSDKFRILLSSLGVPLDVPTEMHKLHKFYMENDWVDAPHALTEIRNNIVHPERKFRKRIGSVVIEAWNLGLWFLEVAILALCGYSGKYGNRIKPRWVGEVEDVPWK